MYGAFGNDEKLGGYQIELIGEFEEAGIEGRFCFGLLKGFAMVKVSMSKNSAKTAGKRREVPM
jgi:hypothetical protein